MSTISFELPQHLMSEQHEAILSISDTLFTLVNLDEFSLDFMPDVIILDDCRYRYSGVEYGRGVYRKEEEEAHTLSQVYEPPAHTLEDVIFHGNNFEPDLRCQSAVKLKQYTFSSFLTPEQQQDLMVAISLTRESTVFVAELDQCTNSVIGCIATPKDMQDFLKLHPEVGISRETDCVSTKKHTGVVSRQDYGYVESGSLVEVEIGSFLASSLCCTVCKALSDKLSHMLDNPPGFDGIKVGNDHFGNKYIDHGWQEAVRRLQSFMAEHGYRD